MAADPCRVGRRDGCRNHRPRVTDAHLAAGGVRRDPAQCCCRYRVTDLYVKNTVPGIPGLSVSSDRIGVTTMRCAALLSQLAGGVGRTVVRTGSGPVAEVYPAASLVRWGFNHKGYKGRKGKAGCSQLVDELLSVATWLDLGKHEVDCRESDDALDAVLASMTARAAALGMTEPIPAEAQAAAETEGWIALPRTGTTLAELATSR